MAFPSGDYLPTVGQSVSDMRFHLGYCIDIYQWALCDARFQTIPNLEVCNCENKLLSESIVDSVLQ